MKKKEFHIEVPGGADKVLLHTCCAPCSSAIIECLMGHGVRPVIYYCNPNIYPLEEYNIRKDECTRYARSLGLDIIDADYDHPHWLDCIKGMENEPERGGRCLRCFKMRLRDTALYAHEHGFTVITTTLASSRWKSLDQINEAGRYAVEKGETMLNLYRKLRSGRQTPVKLVIPTVRTMDRLAGALDKKLMLDSVTLANAFADTTFCKKYGYDTATIACLFIPNTYEVYWNISLDDFMKRMIKENKAFWTPQRLAKAHEAGLTTNDVITLASIVDEETANNSEKPMVAGMYINRLNRDMPLQADPTIKFALKNFELKRIYHNLLDTDSPYNTYKNIGLPPGPIRIASIAGIDAVLNHQKHDYLYMCAKEDFSGTHNFARTYAEHLRNAEKYTEALNKRGIK